MAEVEVAAVVNLVKVVVEMDATNSDGGKGGDGLAFDFTGNTFTYYVVAVQADLTIQIQLEFSNKRWARRWR